MIDSGVRACVLPVLFRVWASQEAGQDRLERVRLLDEAAIGRVRAVDGGFAVGIEQRFAAEDMQAGDALSFELRDALTQGLTVALVALGVVRSQEGVGEGAVFDQEDGGVGPLGAESLDERAEPFSGLLAVEIGLAVDDVDRSVDFSEQVREREVEPALAS